MLRGLELSHSEFEVVAQRAVDRGVEFMSTAFDRGSLRFLASRPLIRRVKVASGELTNAPFIMESARLGLPVIISTGMATTDEISLALDAAAYAALNTAEPSSLSDFRGLSGQVEAQQWLRESVTLLHCTSEYPAPLDEINLRAMVSLREQFGVPVGYSDHSLGTSVAVGAVALGACVIEKHLTLDRTLDGPDHRASLEPADFRRMVNDIREVSIALGDAEKMPTPSELGNRPLVRKSLVATRHIVRGAVILPDDIAAKRPGGGVSPAYYWDVVGSPATQNFEPDDLIVWSSP